MLLTANRETLAVSSSIGQHGCIVRSICNLCALGRSLCTCICGIFGVALYVSHVCCLLKAWIGTTTTPGVETVVEDSIKGEVKQGLSGWVYLTTLQIPALSAFYDEVQMYGERDFALAPSTRPVDPYSGATCLRIYPYMYPHIHLHSCCCTYLCTFPYSAVVRRAAPLCARRHAFARAGW